jgi:hypothetical protein
MAFYELEPWGPERADLNAGILASTMANLWAKGKFDVGDFMPDFTGERTARPTQDRLRKKLMMFAAMFGAKLPEADKPAPPRDREAKPRPRIQPLNA